MNSTWRWHWHAAADDGAVEHAERGEQGGGAVPLIVVRHGLAAPGLDRQSGLGAVERLDLALFVEREHHSVGRRIDIEPNNVGEVGGKARIARALEGAHPVRPELVCPPDALHRFDNVRYLGQFGEYMLTASFSARDPIRTIGLRTSR